MIILSAQGLNKAHGLKKLFSNLTFGIEERDRIGIIGINGTGKSTLMMVLAGAEPPDSGLVTKRQDLRVSYLPQKPLFDPDETVIEHVLSGKDPTVALVREYELLSHQIELNPESAALHRRLDELNHQMDMASAWEIEGRAHTILSKLGVEDLDARLGDLSGGYRKRVALAHALLTESDVLFLDEPTNHLDVDMIAWLEEYLKRFSGSVVLVTHDRYFLDRVTNRIWEIDRGDLRKFEGNFSFYLERKAELEEAQAAQDSRKRNILRNEMIWLKRGARARTTKQKARVDRITEMKETPTRRPQEEMKFETSARRMGTKIIELKNVSKSFGSKVCVRGFTHTFTRGERLGIVGPNGCGKTTLINMITGNLAPDSGEIETGSTVAFGYYDQESHGLDPNERAIEYVKREGGEMLRVPDGSIITAASVMERFLFTPQMLYTPVGKLSGGEQRRLYLIKTLMRDPNFLVLDEPTNDLDIATLQALEDYLDGFGGCLLVISHDRYFIDRTVDKLLAYEGNGVWKTYPGSYSVYAEMRDERESGGGAATSTQQKTMGGETKPESVPATRKLSYKEQRELADLEKTIAQLETRGEELNGEIAAAASDYTKLQKLTAEQKSVAEKLEASMQRWEKLATLAEGARKS